ncbi:MAG: DUF11 domain-containing protein [Planctomycetes bacterium]|nr:DUF11 domain-containing protein [Planctomycetota bacterium]
MIYRVLRRWFGPRRARPYLRRPRVSLRLERLEDRCVPAVISVTGTGDTIAVDGLVTLREAITSANNNANVNSDVVAVGTYGTDTIQFNIAGAGVHTISPSSPLPSINDPLFIDGYSQPGASPNTHAMTDPDPSDNAVLQIEINGSIVNGGNGLILGDLADGSKIRGVVIDQGFGIGILVVASDVHIEGCFIGVDPTGTTAHGMSQGIFFAFNVDTSNGVVGGTTPDARNIISGNNIGIYFQSGSNELVAGNFIGVDASGGIALTNSTGIIIQTSGGVLVGGTSASARNIIVSPGNSIQVNTGTGSAIEGNFIGIDVTGAVKLATSGTGIDLESTSSGTQVGGLTSTPGTGPGNVIGGQFGIQIAGSNNGIKGNLIGTDATGTQALGIGLDGIRVDGSGAVFNTIGGPPADARNVISACGLSGIHLTSAGAQVHDTLIQGNFIGTDINGNLNSMGNGEGVFVQVSTNSQILNNVIAGNSGRGVDVSSAVNTAILGNSIFANGSLGIDLVGGTQNAFAVTANDPGDGDPGPNNLQNFPVITSVSRVGGTTITGTLNSTPNMAFNLEFFANDAADASGHGEGQIFLGALTTGLTDVNGDVSFTAMFPVTIGALQAVTVTATDPAGNTSEFSEAFGPPSLSINNVSVTEGNSGTVSAVFTVSLSRASTDTVTVDFASADGTATTANNDYLPTSGTLTFNPGQTSQTITVQVNGDTFIESNEAFTVNLSNAQNATINDGAGTGTILNDDTLPTLAINNVAVTEGNSGTASAVFTVSLSANPGQTVTVDFATVNGTATTADNDYQPNSGTLTFNPGQTSKTITVLVNGDAIFENNETFIVNLSNPQNATINTGTGAGTILNDDAPPTLAINNVSQSEGNSGTTAFTFTVTLSGATELPATVQFATADGAATTADNDYQSNSGTLTFNPGDSSKTITVLVNGDTAFENDETFAVNLSSAQNATISTATGTGTILNDDTAPPNPSLSISNASVTEGNSGTVNAVFTVTLSAAAAQTVSVDFATADGTATTADNDFQSNSGTLTFNPGQTSKTITVLVNGDVIFENNETFTVNLSNPQNATINTGIGTGTIQNDDAPPTLAINNVSQNEGNSGTTAFTFTVTLTGATELPATVQFATASGTATTADNDFQSNSGTLTFNPGQTSKTITVLVNGDVIFESNETFTVNLSNPQNATISTGTGTGTGTGTIQNDDAPPTLAINNVSQNEGNSGTTTFSFTVTLSGATELPATVQFATADGSATTAGNDYQPTNGTLTFNPGDASKTVTVLVNGDTAFENDESFTVNLSNAQNATISAATGTGTILNEDAAPPTPTLSINSVTVTEGNSGTASAVFTVTLSTASAQTVTVDFATANGTATSADNDYQPASGTLTFNPGDTSKTITVLVNGDAIFENNETFSVNLSNPQNATLSSGTGTGTLLNDDAPPTLAIDNVSQNEGNSSTTAFTFTVTLSGATELPATVQFATADGTATTAGNDFQSNSGTLTFNPGQTSKSITVLVNGDAIFENNETFTVNLNNPQDATINSGTGTGTILNDDAPPTLAINNISQNEGNSGTTAFTFTVTLSGATELPATVQFAAGDGTATTADNDYQSNSGTLTFNPGDTSKTITVQVNGDTNVETDETFTVNLSNPQNATASTATGNGAILNDDAVSTTPALAINSVAVTEGNSGTASAVFTVTLSAASAQTVSVQFSTADGSATAADNDYQPLSGTLTFNPGDTSKTITVLVNGDTIFESDETFTVNLSNPQNATINTGTGTGTISNDDAAPTLAINNVSQNEGNSGTTAFTFTVTLSGATELPATVQFVTTNGTATTADNDFQSSSGTLNFNPGDTSKTITVLVNGDAIFESNESFTVTLTNPQNATINTSTGAGTILNDDAPPTLAINNVSQNEGNSGTTAFTFTVTLSGATELPATVQYATADGTATVANNDYQPATGTLTFNPGQTSKTITVQVNGDAIVENNETFTVNLSNVQNANISTATGTGTILNDDVPTQGQADLAVTKVSVVHKVFVGQTISFGIVLRNLGPANATNVILLDMLPAGFTFISAKPSQGTYDRVTGMWSVGTVLAKHNVTLRITARANGTVLGTVQNTAKVIASDEPDPNSANNQKSALVTIVARRFSIRCFLARWHRRL